MGLFGGGGGVRTRRLAAYLKRRERTPPEKRPALDGSTSPRLFRKRAVVFTDTADFTLRAAKDGILHFLMAFARAVDAARAVVARHGGDVVKVEGDSLLLRFDEITTACRAVEDLEARLARMNRSRPPSEQMHFSYGIGYGEVLDLEDDVFGLEVNLASKIGEDLAKPGEVLLTPSAGAGLDAATLKRVVPYKVVPFGKVALPVQQLKLRRR